jgi:hypothetical protein
MPILPKSQTIITAKITKRSVGATIKAIRDKLNLYAHRFIPSIEIFPPSLDFYLLAQHAGVWSIFHLFSPVSLLININEI